MTFGRETWMAVAALAGAALAGSTGDARIPRELPAMPDVATQAPAVVKTAAQVTPSIAATTGTEPRPALRSASPLGRLPRPAEVLWSTDAHATPWARGTTYKCSFGSEGATFIPFLGASAPRNYPVQFRLAHAAAGGAPIAFDADAPASREGDRVAYDRGAIVEVYDAALESIEQSFVIQRLPNRGELVLRIAVDSDLLPAEATDSLGGLEFRGELGSVRYGNAVVVDAASRTATVPAKLAPGGIEIRVPADVVASAELPLTIDPIVSTWQVDTTPSDDYAPDVAYDADTHRVLTVYEQTFSATDHDVIASMRYDDGFSIPGGYLIIDGSSDNWSCPKVANNNWGHDFLVVAQAGPDGSREIQGRLVVASSCLLSPAFPISAGSGDKLHPTVGGDPSPTGPSFFCVAWERVISSADHDIHARLVDNLGQLHGPNTIFVDNTASTLDEYPELSKSDGAPPSATQAWTVVWQRQASPGDEDVYGAQLAWDGAITAPTFPIDDTVDDSLNPRVSSILDHGARRYLVAWQRVVGASDWEIRMSLRNGPVQDAVANLNTLEQDGPAPDKVVPALDSDGSQFALTYTIDWGNGLADVYLSDIYASGNALGLGEARSKLSVGQATVDWRTRIASMHGSGGSGHDYFLAWDHKASSQDTQREILGARFTAPVGGPYTQFCWGPTSACPCANNGSNGGCGNSARASGALLEATGSASVTEDSLVLHGSGMPATSFCIYMQGTTTVLPVTYGDGKRCIGGTMIRLKAKHNVNGMSQYPAQNETPISIRGNVPPVGASRSYQVLYRDPAPFCTPATFNISNGVQVSWTP